MNYVPAGVARNINYATESSEQIKHNNTDRICLDMADFKIN